MHKTLDESDKSRIKEKLSDPDTSVISRGLEEANGHVLNPEIFANLILPPLINAVSQELSDISFYYKAGDTFKNFPDSSAKKLLEVSCGEDASKAHCALLQLDLLVMEIQDEGTNFNVETKDLMQSSLTNLLAHEDHLIALAAQNILNLLHR